MDNTSNGMPQFAKAEPAPSASTQTCGACKRPIVGSYYQINRQPVCPDCTQRIQAQQPKDTHAAFVRAVSFGIAGAIAGFILYVVFALATGLVFGLVSLAVGYIVGKAMQTGSRGVGGRRYQIAAVVLTYLAVSMSAVPLAIHHWRQTHASASVAEPAATSQAPVNVAKAVGVLAVLGIASPFLALQDPVHGVIGIIILFVGIRFAWRLTAGRSLLVSGPYAPASPGVV